MNVINRLRSLRKTVDEYRQATAQSNAIAQFLERYGLTMLTISTADLEHVAAGDWDSVESPYLQSTQCRARWEAFAPAVLLANRMGDEENGTFIEA
jgi:hypothetical protein